MSDKDQELIGDSPLARTGKGEGFDAGSLPASITDVRWVSRSTTTEYDLRFSDGTPVIRVGYSRATLFGFKNNGVKIAQASFSANYRVLVPGYYWHLYPTVRLERADDSYLVILGGREVTGKIATSPTGLLYGSSLIRGYGDEGSLYDVIRDFAQFRTSWRIWANPARVPQGDL